MKNTLLSLMVCGIVGCNKSLDPISYLACEQDYQKADKIYVMTDTDKDFVMVQFGNAFMAGRNLVPNPPTGKMAFLIFI